MTKGLCAAAPRQCRLQGIRGAPLRAWCQNAQTLQRPRQNGLNAAKLGAMPLEEYKRKRDFRKTPEPAGASVGGAAARGGRFVVQRHRATRLHYDFRLEIDGVLVSWAVPRGPTLDPGARRMAMHVQERPSEHLEYECACPRG